MSEGRLEVVRVGPVLPHENADRLQITQVHAYPVVLAAGSFREGDLAVYVPVDSLVPVDRPEFAFLAAGRPTERIRARRLRGMFSMGLLVAAPPDVQVGDDLAEAWGVTRYEPPVPLEPGGDDAPPPPVSCPVYDLEGLRRWPGALRPGEEVAVTEKLHGESWRGVWNDGGPHVGSRTRWKAAASKWWTPVGDGACLSHAPGVVLYGEIHGYTGGFPYGTGGRPSLRIFDAWLPAEGRFLDYDDLLDVVRAVGLLPVPELYRGPWSPELAALAEGKTTLGGDHVREGIVVRPVRERTDPMAGRCVFKLHGQGFLLK